MAYLNENYLKLQAGYLFPEIGRRIKEFCAANPEAGKRLIRCGIGDVTEPLPPAVVTAMKAAVDELSVRETFRGYPPEQGYEFLRSKIAQIDYRERGIEIAEDEIFRLRRLEKRLRLHPRRPRRPEQNRDHESGLSGLRRYQRDGGAHRQRRTSPGRFEGIIYLPCRAENNFVAEPPNEHADIVYLCFPNNPTGAVATRAQLEQWVAYAQEHKAILLYDAAYEGYISEPEIPRSIFEIPGALERAVEFRSFSKTGGFTGVRCGFTVMSKRLLAATSDGRELPLHKLWHRRWSTKANGVSYPVQRGAEALYSPEGRAQVRELVEHYMGNARILSEAASARRAARLRRQECALHLGRHAPRPNELADV